MHQADTAPERDLVLLSERIITMDPGAGTPQDGLLVRGGRIERFVARDEVEGLRGAGADVVDVGRRPVMPGFVDPHAHAEDVAKDAFGAVDCRAPECATVADVLEVLAEACREAEPGAWVMGQANLFFDRKLRDRRFPTREELDSISGGRPVAIRAGGHLTLLNSRALEVSGIDAGYVPPEASLSGRPIIHHDESGAPTGVVGEMDSLLPFPTLDAGQIREALRKTLRDEFSAYGVTTIGEISGSRDGVNAMDSLAGAGELPVRMRLYLWAPGTVSLDEALDWRRTFPFGAGEDRLKIQGLKLFADGGYSARNAAVKSPYVGTSHCGHVALEADDLARTLAAASDAGLQVAIHANGNRAQEWLCDVITANGGSPGGALRTRIEHAGNFLPDRETDAKWREAGIIPVPQPVFIYNFGDYFADYLGEYGTRGRFPFRTLLDDGWRLSGSSDVWVGCERGQSNPLFSVWCCVARTSFAGNVIDPREAITVEEALRMHTIDAAWVLGEDGEKGSLTPGKLADIIVLDRDPCMVPTDDLRRIKVERTYVGGVQVHGA